MLECEVLVGELLAVDRLAAGAVAVGEIATLTHELRDDAVEGAALVADASFAGAQRAEVFGRLRHDVGAELDDDPAQRFSIGGHVEEAAGQFFLVFFVCRQYGLARGDGGGRSGNEVSTRKHDESS